LLIFGIVVGVLVTNCGSSKNKARTSQSKSDSETNADEDAPTDETAENAATDPKETEKPKKNEKTAVKTTDKPKKSELEAIWQDLASGNKRFMAGKHTVVNYSADREKLVKGQQPKAIVLGCADSRVPPEFLFDKNLGELFVVRDAGNIADKVTLGSIEYAVEHLHAKVLVVLGHESCGAVAATVAGEKMPTPNLQSIVESISPSFADSKTCLIGGESNLSCVELNVQHSSKDVLSKSPLLKKAVDAGELLVIRAVYKLKSGEVVRLD
jgi:carbonic anhydrase